MARMAQKDSGIQVDAREAQPISPSSPKLQREVLAACDRVLSNVPEGIPGVSLADERAARAKIHARLADMMSGVAQGRELITPDEYIVLQRALRVNRLAFWTKLYSFPCAQDAHIGELQNIVDRKTRYGGLKALKTELGDVRKAIRETLETVDALKGRSKDSDPAVVRALIAGHIVRFVTQPERALTVAARLMEGWDTLRSLECSSAVLFPARKGAVDPQAEAKSALRRELGGDIKDVARHISEMLRHRDAYLAVRDFVYQMNSKLVFVGMSAFNHDAIQTSSLGLLSAIERFDPLRQDVKSFANFATASIQWARKTWSRQHNSLVGCARRHREMYDLRDRLGVTNARFSVEDIQGLYSVSKKDAIALLHLANERVGVAPSVADTRTSEASRDAEANENREFLERGFRALLPRQREMIALYYGLSGESLNLQQIGDRYSVTKERTRQIIADGLKRMKALLVEDFSGDIASAD